MSQPTQVYHGSYSSNLAAGEYPLSWPSMDAMTLQLRKEEWVKFIELRLKEVVQHPHNHWDKKLVYICSRQGTGGVKAYEKRKAQHRNMVPTKWVSCPCCLVVKSYPNMNLVLEQYDGSQSHPVGKDNAKFTQLSQDVHILIAKKLQAGVPHAWIVWNLLSVCIDLTKLLYSLPICRKGGDLHLPEEKRFTRDNLLSSADIHQIEVRFHFSTLIWS